MPALVTALAHRIRRTTAIAASLAAGSTLALAGTATAHSGNPCGARAANPYPTTPNTL
ncbi:hypothetical protein OG530_01740 [Streptomyces decoyicus]|uniref:hypothetical protein n=1 Tax=Streptomyces decoyicus TaxID=249567 RepID=UPI002E16CD34